MAIDVGSVADWAAAFGSIFAAVVALRLAGRAERSAAADIEASRKALASILSTELEMVGLKLAILRTTLSRDNAPVAELARSVQAMVRGIVAPAVQTAVLNFRLMDPRLASLIAGVGVMLAELQRDAAKLDDLRSLDSDAHDAGYIALTRTTCTLLADTVEKMNRELRQISGSSRHSGEQ